jgi:hypothetical protein
MREWLSGAWLNGGVKSSGRNLFAAGRHLDDVAHGASPVRFARAAPTIPSRPIAAISIEPDAKALKW